jgi:2'-5' RNA ligase
MKPKRSAEREHVPAPKDNLLRTFIAVELDDNARQALGTVLDELKPRAPKGSVRWVNPDSVHLTLKFLGDTPAKRIAEIEAALAEACAPFPAFAFVIEGRGCFPNFRRPNIVWVAVRDRGKALAHLQEAIEAKIAPLGWPTEKRPFQPHLTLGRVNRDGGPEVQAAVGAAVEAFEVDTIATVPVAGVSLMQSELRPGGSVYTRLFEARLGVGGRIPEAGEQMSEAGDQMSEAGG